MPGDPISTIPPAVRCLLVCAGEGSSGGGGSERRDSVWPSDCSGGGGAALCTADGASADTRGFTAIDWGDDAATASGALPLARLALRLPPTRLPRREVTAGCASALGTAGESGGRAGDGWRGALAALRRPRSMDAADGWVCAYMMRTPPGVTEERPWLCLRAASVRLAPGMLVLLTARGRRAMSAEAAWLVPVWAGARLAGLSAR